MSKPAVNSDARPVVYNHDMLLTHPEHLRVQLPLEKIAQLCSRYDVAELAVFGSALRDDFRSDSDIDFLVTFTNGDAGPWACKFDELKHDLELALGREVDVVSRGSIESSENYLRRRHILSSTQVLYVA